MDLLNKIVELRTFLISETDFFEKTLQNADKEVYSKDPILKRAIDKSLNDIILAAVDLSANFLRLKKRALPKTYRDIVLATYEFVGDSATKMAALIKCRNETIHDYLKLNWENVKTVKNAKIEIIEFIDKIVGQSKEKL